MLLGLNTLASFLAETRSTRRRHFLYHHQCHAHRSQSVKPAYRNALLMLYTYMRLSCFDNSVGVSSSNLWKSSSCGSSFWPL